MSDLNEDAIEQNLIDLLVAQGYQYFHGSSLAPNGDNPQRAEFDSVVLENQFKSSLETLNPSLPETALTEAYQQVLYLGSNDIMTNNERFHQMLTDGINVEVFEDGQSTGALVKLIDVSHPENNSFWAVNQFVIKENNQSKRLDVVLFVNGLPLVVIELKSAISEKATLDKAYTQIQNYKQAIPSIFYYNALCVISDGLDARTSSVSAPYSRYLTWKSPEKAENGVLPELQIMADNMLKPDVLLNLIRFNTMFESEEVKDDKTGLLSLVKIKKIAAYHQYYVVKKAIQSTLRAVNLEGVKPEVNEDPESYGLTSVKDQPQGDMKAGVVWHTQGSGKSLSMVFYAGQLVVEPAMRNPTIVILTDRNDLDDQLFTTFGYCSALLRQTPVQAENREHIKELLKVSGGGIIFTTIQKFYPENDSSTFELLSNRGNIVVVADEAHRSQYGFTGRIDEKGNLKYGNAKYMRDALPNATYIGFTGTPIEKEDRDTKKVFGNYIDIYDIAQAVEDGATVPLSYESRLVKIKLNESISKKIDGLVDGISDATPEQIEKGKQKNAQINAVVGHPDRLKDIAKDIVEHFSKRQSVFEGKGMIVSMTRFCAVDLYAQIIKLKPEWHHDELTKGCIKVVMTSSSDDPEAYQPHHTSITFPVLIHYTSM